MLAQVPPGSFWQGGMQQFFIIEYVQRAKSTHA
jgi:hypothetical protein